MNPNCRADLERLLAEEKQPLRVGMVVWLKSSGPAMVIRSITGTQTTCEWFDKEKKIRSHKFVPSSLTPVQPRDDGKPRGILLIGDLGDSIDEETTQQ